MAAGIADHVWEIEGINVVDRVEFVEMEAAAGIIALLFGFASAACMIAFTVLLYEIAYRRKPGVPWRRSDFWRPGNIAFRSEDLTPEALRLRKWLPWCIAGALIFFAIAFAVAKVFVPQ